VGDKAGDKPDEIPTVQARNVGDPEPPVATAQSPRRADPEPPSPRAGDAEPPLATMQMPRGGPAGAGPPAMPPLMTTLVPSTESPLPASAPPLMPQEGRYTIQSEIARGGMGRVVEATDTLLGRTVALKEALSLDPDALRRFQRETRITARLEHPSIVPVHDAGISASGQPYYVMRKVGGRPLEDIVARADGINARLALVPNVVAAAQAIAHAHERGIVHRDIKPSNILVGDHGETIVIDWGLAKAIDEADDPHAPVQRVIENDDSIKTRAGIVFGTPGFMAPEQLRGKTVDERCDVYALGATLYHLLARRPPHHAKGAEVMMKAAVAGPPTPLAEIVDGVPPELTTIVDKALAHDANRRYQDAGALADDLQRFLTGQLVKSHYYTPREMVMRFVRKHRNSVLISIAATVALLGLAAFFVQQIRDERDRADEQARIAVLEAQKAEQQREEVVEKSKELVLNNARHSAADDPTRALAMVKPLVDAEHWRAARDVGAAASVHGVAFSLPASPHTLTLELSRDGARALAAGDDGIVRIYDLAKRESRVIADMKGAVMARFADGERQIVLFQGNRLSVIDAASGDKTDITAPTAISQLEVSGPIVYWVDPANAVWKLDLAGTAPVKLEIAEPVHSVAPSPDGRWIALAGKDHLLLVDRTNSTLPPEILTQGQTKSMSWSAESNHLVVLIDDEVIDVNFVPVPQIFRRITVGVRFSAAYSGGRIYSAGPTGVGIVEPQGTRLRGAGPEYTVGVHEGRNRVVIAAKPQGEILVLSDHGDHTLRCPSPIAMVATSAHGPWIVAASDHRLLVWNLDAIEPRLLTNRSPSSARFITGDHVVVTYFDEPAEWIDLRKHTTVQLGVLGAIETVAPAPSGDEAVVIDGSHRAWRLAGLGQPQELDGEVSAATFIDDRRLVLAGPGGLRLDDAQHGTKLALYAHDAATKTLVATPAGGGWIAAAFADGVLWRKHLQTNAVGELQLGALKGSFPLVIADDGTVVFSLIGELRAWRPDGEVDVIAKPITGVLGLALADKKQVIALTESAVHLVELGRSATPAPPVPVARPDTALIALLGKSAALARTGGLLAAPTVTGGVEVVDPLVDWRWPLVTPQKGQSPFSVVDIAPDGSRVLAWSSTQVFVWTLDLPDDAESTRAWLANQTNAIADKPSGPLGWP
jgi:WD40 repeat protein